MEDDAPVLAVVKRGAIIEARHRGAVVVVDRDGGVLASLGDPLTVTSTRSAIKAIQAIPFLTSGAADRFEVQSRELAVACASHNGETIHTDTVAGMLGRAGLSEDDLLCGAHAPYCEERAKELERQGLGFSALHNNCSGKHAAMLMTAVHRGYPTADYVAPTHPLQREIVSLLMELGGLDAEPAVAVDGCSAPTFAVPLRSLALIYARLVSLAGGRSGEDEPRASIKGAATRLVGAMIEHPEMIGGTSGRLDSDLLRAAGGKLICKIGAEAVYAIGILPCDRFPDGAGVAIKVEDGSYRGLGPTVIEALLQLGVLERGEADSLDAYHRPPILNRRGLIVGEVQPVLMLHSIARR